MRCRSVGLSVGTIVGPAIAGVLVAVTDPGWAIGLDALTFAVSGALLTQVKPLGLVAVSEGRGFFADLAGPGREEVRSRTWLWLTIVDAALFQFAVLGSFFVLRAARRRARAAQPLRVGADHDRVRARCGGRRRRGAALPPTAAARRAARGDARRRPRAVILPAALRLARRRS